MTPPCPNCGTIYSEGPEVNGWCSVSIADSVVFEDKLDGSPAFWGHEYYCTRCNERWRVAIDPQPSRPCSS